MRNPFPDPPEELARFPEPLATECRNRLFYMAMAARDAHPDLWPDMDQWVRLILAWGPDPAGWVDNPAFGPDGPQGVPRGPLASLVVATAVAGCVPLTLLGAMVLEQVGVGIPAVTPLPERVNGVLIYTPEDFARVATALTAAPAAYLLGVLSGALFTMRVDAMWWDALRTARVTGG